MEQEYCSRGKSVISQIYWVSGHRIRTDAANPALHTPTPIFSTFDNSLFVDFKLYSTINDGQSISVHQFEDSMLLILKVQKTWQGITGDNISSAHNGRQHTQDVHSRASHRQVWLSTEPAKQRWDQTIQETITDWLTCISKLWYCSLLQGYGLLDRVTRSSNMLYHVLKISSAVSSHSCMRTSYRKCIVLIIKGSLSVFTNWTYNRALFRGDTSRKSYGDKSEWVINAPLSFKCTQFSSHYSNTAYCAECVE